MTIRVQAFVLLLFGAALLRLGAGPQLLRYVRPSARPWVLLAGALVAVLALWTLVVDARHPAASSRAAPGRAGDHSHDHDRPALVAWLITGPVLAVLVVAPPALGVYSATRTPAVVARPASTDFPPLPAGDPVPLTPGDVATRVLWGDAASVAGRRLAVTGFVSRVDAATFTLSRLVITCCAADARPVDIAVTWPGGPPSTGAWVQVTGIYAGTADGVPRLAASAVLGVPSPEDPYD